MCLTMRYGIVLNVIMGESAVKQNARRPSVRKIGRCGKEGLLGRRILICTVNRDFRRDRILGAALPGEERATKCQFIPRALPAT